MASEPGLSALSVTVPVGRWQDLLWKGHSTFSIKQSLGLHPGFSVSVTFWKLQHTFSISSFKSYAVKMILGIQLTPTQWIFIVSVAYTPYRVYQKRQFFATANGDLAYEWGSTWNNTPRTSTWRNSNIWSNQIRDYEGILCLAGWLPYRVAYRSTELPSYGQFVVFFDDMKVLCRRRS